MNFELAGRSALVTGASRGIGHAIAALLHSEGCRVALNARSQAGLSSAASGLDGAIAVSGDVTIQAVAERVVRDTVERFGALDIVICNVGSGSSVPPGDETPEEWQRVFSVNLWSATNVVQAARPHLSASHGAVVCVSSICGLEVVPGAPVTYSAAKAALHAYVRGIARPLGRHGIRINAVAPGNILFEGSGWARRVEQDAVGVEHMLQRDVPVGRLGAPIEVARLVTYLASPLAGFATGQVWTLDGGQARS